MGIFIGIIIICWVIKLLSDASISADFQRRGRESFEEGQRALTARRMEQAWKDDVYCTPNLGFTDPTRHFDGSPKK